MGRHSNTPLMPPLAHHQDLRQNVQIPSFVQKIMHTLALSEFRANVSAMLDLVEQGQTVRILRHGKPVAELVPVKPDAEASEKKMPSWKQPFEPVIQLAPGQSVVKALLDEREQSPW
jgi:prevent-host-death family protein